MKLTVKLVAAAALVAATGASFAQSGDGRGAVPNFNPVQQKAQEAACVAFSDGFLTRADAVSRLRMIATPSYWCYMQIRSNQVKRAGYVTGTIASETDYNAWKMGLSAYLSQPHVKAYAGLSVGGQDDFVHRLAADVDVANQKLLVDGYKHLIASATGLLHDDKMDNKANEATHRYGMPDYETMCTTEQREAVAGIKDPNLRQMAKAKLAECDVETARIKEAKAKAAAKEAKAKAERDAYRLPTAQDLKPVPSYALGEKQTAEQVQALMAHPDVSAVTVGVDSAPLKMQLVIDLGLTKRSKSRLALLYLWPAVRDGQLQLTIVPTSVASGDAASAAALFTSSKPYTDLDAWLSTELRNENYPFKRMATAPAPADVLEKVKKLDAVVSAADLVELPRFVFLDANGARAKTPKGELVGRTAGVPDMPGLLSAIGVKLDVVAYTSAQQDFIKELRTGYWMDSAGNPKTRQVYDYDLKGVDNFFGLGPIARWKWSDKQLCAASGECWKTTTKAGFFD